MTALETTDKWKVKGISLKNVDDFLSQRIRPGFFMEKAREIGLLKTSIILASSWYSASLFDQIYELAAEELDISVKKMTLEITEHSLKTDLNGIYRFFMKVSGTKNVLSKMPRMAATYTNFGTLEIIRNEKGIFETSHEIPDSMAKLSVYQFEGAISGVLEVCGSRLEGYNSEKTEVFTRDGELFARVITTIKYQ